MCSCLCSLLLIILTYPLGWFARRHLRATPAPGEPVVVCLHGIYHNPAAFLAIRPALIRAGFKHILVPGYCSLSGDFETVAARLLTVLRREIPPHAPLILVGHSLGGLFARRLMFQHTGMLINFGFVVVVGFVVGTAVTGQIFYNFTLDNLRYFGVFKAMLFIPPLNIFNPPRNFYMGQGKDTERIILDHRGKMING